MLILASGSPRRREILTMLGYRYEVSPAKTDETLKDGSPPEAAAAELSRRKAEAVAKKHPADVVLGADTLVYSDGVLLGKPAGEKDAAKMLAFLSGKTHKVYTGVTIAGECRSKTWVTVSDVTFRALTEEEIAAYVATGEPMDKAGAYAVQGRGSAFVKGICGDFFSVMGLPSASVVEALKEFGILQK